MKPDTKSDPHEEVVLKGIGVSDGIAMGPAFVIGQHGVPVPIYALSPQYVDKEIKRFYTATNKAQKQLSLLKQKAESLPAGSSEEVGLLMDAYKGMLQPGSRLVKGVEEFIRNERLNAESAVQKQIAHIVASFEAMGDPYLASRAVDVRDVGDRLIRHLLSQNYNPFADAPEGSILVAEEITPADAALINPDKVSGLSSVLGGAEGHTAIMARAMRLPAVMGVAALIRGVQNEDIVIVDGTRGEIILRPTKERLHFYKQEYTRLTKERARLKALARVSSVTKDGTPIHLQANLELPKEAAAAHEAGATGIGLLRTEFLFMNRPDLPDEDEQYAVLRHIIDAMDGKPVTIRTLDVGGEKLASALGQTIGESQNPALGLRAIRLGLKMPTLLDTQLAAILRASVHGKIRILIPMVSSANQMRLVRERLHFISQRLRKKGVKIPAAPPSLGAMIEIPAAALAADALSKVSDFFAIGSNDLTQYTLAIDRGDDRVADLYDPYHPAVLRLIQFSIAAAWRANIPVSLCGEMAGDPRATSLLLGFGLRDFSMAPSRLLVVKERIRSIHLNEAVDFAEKILSKTDESDIKNLLDSAHSLYSSDSTRKRK